MAVPVCTCPPSYAANDHHETPCPLYVDTDSKENDDVSIKEGPLTERQVRIIEGLLAGKRHEEISRDLSTPDETISVNVVKRECMHITAKFKARTITQAVFIYSEAQAYRKAAREILKTRIPVPFDQSDEHANHVLEGLAKLYQGRHDAWMPS